ncbi:MAG: hypothetical protein WBH77_06000 [Saccharofermentanales bacterium]
MFSKLYKYQVKELWYIARYFYVAMLGTVLLSFLVSATRIPGVIQFVNSLSMIGFLLSGIASIIFIIIYDYQNQQGKRSYFFRSIPAKESAIFGSRAAYYCTYYFITVLLFVIGLAVFIISDTAINMMLPFNVAFSIIKDFVLRSKVIGLIIFFVVYTGIELIISMMFAITIGSQAGLKRLGIGGPVLVYFLHYIALQIITLISMLYIPISIRLPDNFETDFQFKIVFENMFSEINKLFSTPSNQITLIGIGFIFTTFITWIIMSVWIYNSSKNRISLN